jgi:transposase
VRQQLAGLPSRRQAGVAARVRPGGPACPAEGTKAAMACAARRHQQLTAEITRLDTMLEELVRHTAPEGFLAKRGVARKVAATLLVTAGDNPGRARREASFAALRGASPVDASSGKQIRHRRNRGGGRHANSALWTIAMTRLAHDPRTKAYSARRTAEGKTRKKIIRCLKRYIAREIYKALCRPQRPEMPSAPHTKQDLSAPALT